MTLPLSYRIRTLIDAVGRPMLASEIKDAFPGEQVAMSLSNMHRRGMLDRTGEPRSFAYSNARTVRLCLPITSDEDRRNRKNRRDRRAYAAMDEAKRAAYLAKKYAARPQPAKKPKAPKPKARKQIAIAPASGTSFTAKPPAPQARPETVAEWMARTGQRPEVLPGVGMRQEIRNG